MEKGVINFIRAVEEKIMSISLCCITKNEQQFLADMLNSVAGLVNELIVVDTGSTDSTAEIARKAGAKVFDYKWKNDFSEARNYSLTKATCDWILVLDADERFEKSDYSRLLEISLAAEPKAVFLKRRHYLGNMQAVYFTAIDQTNTFHKQGAAGYYTTSDLRFFSNHIGVKFKGAVHESAEDSARSLIADVFYSDIVVHHIGPLMAADRLSLKSKFYLELAKNKLSEDPADWRNWFQLGAELQNNSEYENALLHFMHACKMEPQSSENWRQAGICLLVLGRFEESLEFLNKAINLKPACSITLNALGIVFKNLGMLKEAVICFENTLNIDPGNQACLNYLKEIKEKET